MPRYREACQHNSIEENYAAALEWLRDGSASGPAGLRNSTVRTKRTRIATGAWPSVRSYHLGHLRLAPDPAALGARPQDAARQQRRHRRIHPPIDRTMVMWFSAGDDVAIDGDARRQEPFLQRLGLSVKGRGFALANDDITCASDRHPARQGDHRRTSSSVKRISGCRKLRVIGSRS